MKLFKYMFIACLSLLAIVNASAQSDTGISRHNYKHPQKAKLAKATKQEGVEMRTFDYKTMALYQSRHQRGTSSVVPKYAPRYSSAVVPMNPIDRTNENNALKNSSNYKAQQKATSATSSMVASMD